MIANNDIVSACYGIKTPETQPQQLKCHRFNPAMDRFCLNPGLFCLISDRRSPDMIS
jgi:hypothetical protein